MSFVFDIDKVVQASAHVAKKSARNSVNILALLKLLYIADRESLRQRGVPITGDTYAAMKYGPVLSRLYDLTKTTNDWPYLDADETAWCEVFSKCGHDLALISDPGVGDLAPFELDVLDAVYDRYGAYDQFELAHITHDFPEWRNNAAGDSSAPIPLRDVLQAVGRGDEADAAYQSAREEVYFAKLFGP